MDRCALLATLWSLSLWIVLAAGATAGISVVAGPSSSSSGSVVGSGAGNSGASAGVVASSKKDARCEEITIPMCRGIGYNWTSMPNSLHHGTSSLSVLVAKEERILNRKNCVCFDRDETLLRSGKSLSRIAF